MTLPETPTSRWSALEGQPFLLGHARTEEDACNFVYYSKHVHSVTLLLYDESDTINPIFNDRFDYFRNRSARAVLVPVRGRGGD